MVIFEIAPSCFWILCLVVVWFYEYASLGGVFFSGIAIETTGEDENLPNSGSFNTFMQSFFLLYELFVGSAWNTVMMDVVSWMVDD